MIAWPWVFAGIAALLGGGFMWQLVHAPRPIGWVVPESRVDRLLGGADHWIRHRWNPVTRQQAEILAIPAWQVLGFYGVALFGGGVLGYDLLHGVLWAVLLALGAAWKGPAWMIGQQFRGRQGALARDFAPLVLMLRIYLDLGEPLIVALRHTRPALGRIGQAELNRLLSAMEAGQRQEALKQWGRRTGLSTYKLLADTLSQGWDQGLTAQTMQPLDTLIESSRAQGTRALTERLDGMATIVPVIAAFGVMAVLLYALLAGSGIG